ncbi:MAG: adenylyltransferase/cytidyltransferase family protein, partial [Brevinema sp.]
MKYTVGYTSGVFDLFHIGYLNLLRNTKGMCDKLIVGVTTDELVSYKNKKAVIPFEERIEIVQAITYVDAVIPQENMDKLEMLKKLKFNVMFVGDDWYETDKWKLLEKEFEKHNVQIIYFPDIKTTSSTLINQTLSQLRN